MITPKFFEGDIELLNETQIRLSIVGSRSILEITKNYLEDLFQEISNFDICIVSGGMYGVDIFAHNLALYYGMKTIVVLPQGINSYKKSSLFNQLKIDNNSKILFTSEYSPEFKPRKYTFIERNKLISKYSSVTLVAQASIKSGSISTAFSSFKLSKKVISIPFALDISQFQGTNFLISKGAEIYLSPQTVIDSLGIKSELIESKILNLIESTGSSTYEEILREVGSSTVLIQKNLLKLILEGQIFYDGEKYFK